jgi:hypothetical protein
LLARIIECVGERKNIVAFETRRGGCVLRFGRLGRDAQVLMMRHLESLGDLLEHFWFHAVSLIASVWAVWGSQRQAGS